MKRRLTLAILGTVAATLLLAGVGTLALARLGARAQIEDELTSQAEALAVIVAQSNIQADERSSQLRRFQAAARALSLDGIGLFFTNSRGQLVGQVPDGILFLDLDLDRLRGGNTISGAKGGLVFAAAAAPRGTGYIGVVLTRRDTTVVGPAGRWFVIAATITVLIGGLVAARLGRRLTLPLRDATLATQRIAEGDLAARLPEPRPRAQDELAGLARGINAMAETLERSRGLERQFLLSVSHDLRTPLTSIRGYAEAIADGAAPDTKQAASVILSASQRLERLVADLLDLAKLDAKQFSLDLRAVDVVDVTADAVAGFGPAARQAGVNLEVVGVGHPPAALADPDRLAQAVANLIENALRFATSHITVSAEELEGVPRVVVTDDGPGIPEADLPHVFERLYVADHQPRRREVGSGLGLAIVRELVAAMGGTVGAESPPSGGTRMVVTLAAADQTSGSSSMRTEADPPSHTASPADGGSTERRT